MRTLLATSLCILIAACGGGSDAAAPTPAVPVPPDPWQAVTNAIQAAQPQFPGGLVLEVMTPAAWSAPGSSTRAS